MGRTKLSEVRNTIIGKFINGGTIIYLISETHSVDPSRIELRGKKATNSSIRSTDDLRPANPDDDRLLSNLDLSPFKFHIRNVSEGEGIQITESAGTFSTYLFNIRKYDKIFHDFDISEILTHVRPTNESSRMILDLYRRSKSRKGTDEELTFVTKAMAEDNSGNIIASICFLKVGGYWESGKAVFLPRSEESNIEDAIDVILRSYRKEISDEALPDWTYKANPLPRMADIEKTIDILEKERKKLDKEIKKENLKKLELEKYISY